MRRTLLTLFLLSALARPALAVYEGYQIPNAASAAFSAQSKIFDQDLQIVADGARGNGVVYVAGGCAVLPQAAPNMTIRLTTGCTVVSQLATATVATGNVTIAAAHASLPRIDIVSVDNAGTKVATTGTAASSPLPPTIPQSGGVNNIVLAFVYVPAADSAVNANQITDKRIFVNTPGGGGGAGTGLSYITKVAEGTLSNEFAMGSLATGLVQNTVTTGVPTTLAPTDDNTVVGNGTTWQLKALPTCSGATSALTYNISTNAFGCNTISAGGTVTTSGSPANTQVALFTSATAITGDAGLVYDTAADTLTITQAAATGTASSTGALTVVSSGGGTGTFEVSDTATNTIVRPGLLRHTTSGAMTDGFGTAIDFEARDNSAVNNTLGRISAERSGADNTGLMRLRTLNAGTFGDGVVISGTQDVTLPSLASGGTQCVQASSAGLLSGTGAACGGGSGATLTTFATARPADTTATIVLSSLTTRNVTLFELPGSITVNQLSIYFTAITTAGTLRLCLYSNDGATKLVDITITPAGGVVSGAVGSVALTPGRYYAAVGCATTCNVTASGVPGPTTATLFGAGSPAGKQKWTGTVSHTSGTCNTTLGTITGVNTAQPVLRGDQ